MRHALVMILLRHGRADSEWYRFGPNKNSMNMRIGKAILAMIIGLSIAVLPAASAFASAGSTATPVVAQSTSDCDQHLDHLRHHQDHPLNKTQKNTGGCDSMTDCAFKCFTTSTVGFSTLTFLPTAYTPLEHVVIADAVSSQMGHPPFRPPRA